MIAGFGCGHPKCSMSTGIHEAPTFGKGELDTNGFWEKPCWNCARAYEALTGKPSWPHRNIDFPASMKKDRRTYYSQKKNIKKKD